MSKKKQYKTKEEKEFLSKVAQLGCVVCRNLGFGDSPAEIHHIRHGMGTAMRNDHFHILPLCPEHHRNGKCGVAFHSGQAQWEKKYGSEMTLYQQVLEEIKVLEASTI